ncbi:FAD:protein FMN transferase [Aliikangiella maris]|uniref:FAD:protein FMN transferase n=2 Tax=Aliikangiella maris TaxID=3162458 RepID=A0ABV2BQ98_9GAMM
MTIAYSVSRKPNHSIVTFQAMASPCEILLATHELSVIQSIMQTVIPIIVEFENKYSRYQQHNLCWRLNHSAGEKIAIDLETFRMLEYAKKLYQLSEGLFDITSGILRRIWQFKPGAMPPDDLAISQTLPHIGFQNIEYDEQYFTMPANMEVDFGGIGKEYCVDKVCEKIKVLCEQTPLNFLVNLGGDLRAVQMQKNFEGWQVGIEASSVNDKQQQLIRVQDGAVATSGSTKRMFTFNDKVYAHILNPKTGYPIEGAPRSITVLAANCSLAGGMSTLAQLKGEEAENFLNQTGLPFVCRW